MAENAGGPSPRQQEWLEILEVAVLSAVAVLTAWSGYQAARWDGRSAESYVLSASARIRAQEQETLAGQDRLYDITTFNGWLAASVDGKAELAAAFQRRFRPEYAVAFAAWMKTDPLKTAKSPPGAVFMPEYINARTDTAKRLSDDAELLFEQGVADRGTANRYVRITVILSTVLLLTALSQRLKIVGPRRWLLAVALVGLISAIIRIVVLPRA